MDYFLNIQRCIDYIEIHLNQDLDVNEAINKTHMSKFHFYRLFKSVVGVTIHEYIKRRKLSEAAEHLFRTNDDVLTTAVTYGFHSQEVFTRNFKKCFGYPPAQFRKLKPENWQLLATKKIRVDALRLDAKAYNGKVIILEHVDYIRNLTLVGVERVTTNDEGSTVTEAMLHFLDVAEKITNRADKTIYRLCYDIQELDKNETYKELIAYEVRDASHVPDGMKIKHIDGVKVATYTHHGFLFSEEEKKIIDTYQFLYRYRIPFAEHDLTNDFILEKYGADFKGPFHQDSVLHISFSIK
ncbi:AraC family transcriptional regulator [Paenibacillus sp. RRE4]|uniref:AraC family transcriptional regulator n=1 Tax=Paenibacillus sp. RRE4 TaxID=2962587 RepID=UPI002881E74B|nr:AraC family transcriptional regulator [Paenibacillus sp. RRE4]MDT0125516.1 AraC family transcriptional regulator [Paenibacillus sp. RRE4]